MNWTVMAIKELADRNPDGFTVNIQTGRACTKGYAVALTHGLVVEDAALLSNLWDVDAEYSYEFGCATHALGGWKSPVGEYCLDLVLILCKLDDAMSMGKKYNQYSIYDLTNGKEIVLKGE